MKKYRTGLFFCGIAGHFKKPLKYLDLYVSFIYKEEIKLIPGVCIGSALTR